MDPESGGNRLTSRLTLTVGYLALAAVFVYLVVQNWFICDDAFISFRYVRNLVEGRGLVFNVGEHVEGYTNFLWVLELAALWSWFDVRPEQGSLWLSVLYTVGVVLLTFRLAGTTPFSRHRRFVQWMALALLATNATFAVWTSSGLETRQFTFFVVLAISLFWRHRGGDVYLAGGAAAMACAALTRPEGVLLWGTCVAWYLAMARLRSDLRLRPFLLATLPFVVLVGAHFLFRFFYYGEWLPNTYYAKFVRPWYGSGIRYFIQVSIETGLYLLVPLAILGLRARWVRSDGLHLLSAVCILPHAVYLVRLGGDHFEYRPLDFYWPLLALAAADGLMRLGLFIRMAFARYPRSPSESVWTASVFAVVLVYASSIGWTMMLLTRDLQTRAETLRLHVPIGRENAPWLLRLPLMAPLTSIFNEASRLSVAHYVGLRKQGHKVFAERRILRWKPYEAATRGDVFPDDALTPMGAVGVVPFYLPDLRVLDLNGLTDYAIARNPVDLDAPRFMAHERTPLPGYIGARGCNILVRGPAPSESAAVRRAAYALPLAEGLWMPFDVADRDWARRRFAAKGMVPHHYFAPDDPRDNEVEVQGTLLVGRRFLGRFDGDMEDEDWKLEGCFYRQEPPAVGDYVGQGVLSSDRESGPGTGKARSPSFVAEADTYLIMLVGGKSGAEVGVRLQAGDRTVASWRELNGFFLSVVSWPLDALAGERLWIEAFDNDMDGYVVLDHVLIASSPEARRK